MDMADGDMPEEGSVRHGGFVMTDDAGGRDLVLFFQPVGPLSRVSLASH